MLPASSHTALQCAPLKSLSGLFFHACMEKVGVCMQRHRASVPLAEVHLIIRIGKYRSIGEGAFACKAHAACVLQALGYELPQHCKEHYRVQTVSTYISSMLANTCFSRMHGASKHTQNTVLQIYGLGTRQCSCLSQIAICQAPHPCCLIPRSRAATHCGHSSVFLPDLATVCTTASCDTSPVTTTFWLGRSMSTFCTPASAHRMLSSGHLWCHAQLQLVGITGADPVEPHLAGQVLLRRV